MTKRKIRSLVKIGNIIKRYRLELSLSDESRSFFLNDRILKGLINVGDLSEKSLSNIENGYNLPSLSTLKILSVALEVDFVVLIREIYDYIPKR